MSIATEKTERLLKALAHEETDRVPIGEFFSTEFVLRWQQWRAEQGEDPSTDINRYYDLDYLLIEPNIDPHVRSCEIIERTDDYVIFKSGFGCTIKKVFSKLEEGFLAPMPLFLEFSVKNVEDFKTFEFDDPLDPARYEGIRQDIISGDGFTPYRSFAEEVAANRDDFCLVGGVTEPFETLWRIRGSEGSLMDMARYPEEVRAFCERIIDFQIASGKEQIRRGGFPVMYIWGDVSYKQGMMMSPRLWRRVIFPGLQRLCTELHKEGAKIIYHGCGYNPPELVEQFVEAGIDALNPLEAKAGMDPVGLKRRFGKRLALVGGIDNAMVLGRNDQGAVRREVLRKMNAAKGGGYILQSDHSIPGSVPPENYDYMVQLGREHGRYPLQLAECDEAL